VKVNYDQGKKYEKAKEPNACWQQTLPWLTSDVLFERKSGLAGRSWKVESEPKGSIWSKNEENDKVPKHGTYCGCPGVRMNPETQTQRILCTLESWWIIFRTWFQALLMLRLEHAEKERLLGESPGGYPSSAGDPASSSRRPRVIINSHKDTPRTQPPTDSLQSLALFFSQKE